MTQNDANSFSMAQGMEQDIQNNLLQRVNFLANDLSQAKAKKDEMTQMVFGLANAGTALTPELNKTLDQVLTKDQKQIWLSQNSAAQQKNNLAAAGSSGTWSVIGQDANGNYLQQNSKTGEIKSGAAPGQVSPTDQAQKNLQSSGINRVRSGDGGLGFSDANGNSLTAQQAAAKAGMPLYQVLQGSQNKQDAWAQGQYAQNVRFTQSGAKYIDLANYSGNDKNAIASWAASVGVAPISDNSQITTLQSIDTSRMNLQSLLSDTNGILPQDAVKRATQSPGRKINDFLQNKNDQQAFDQYTLAAAKILKTISGMNVRMNKDTVKEAQKFMPSRNDTMQEARDKVSKLQTMLNNAEAPITQMDMTRTTGQGANLSSSSTDVSRSGSKYLPGTTIEYQGKNYTVGSDGNTLNPL
jgi:hypothetical protein